MTSSRLLLTALALGAAVAFTPADTIPADRPVHQAIDHYIDAAVREQDVKPAAAADDATYIRRVTLDLCGRLPTRAEASAYVASTDPNKKAALVYRLMASPGYVRHQVTEFDAMLAPDGGGRRSQGNLREYLTAAFKENRPWDRVYRDLMLPDDKDAAKKGASPFLKSRVRDLDRLTTDVSVLFFGVNISCAQCHDHPLVMDWKQDHYYGLKSFLAPTFESGPNLGEKAAAVVKFKTTKNVEKTAKMMFLTGKVIDPPGGNKPDEPAKKKGEKAAKDAPPPPPPAWSARAALVETSLQADQRDFFAKSIVNRMWHRFFGLGLVSPIDQMHSENAPSNPELLSWLARDTAAHGYDLRRLVRGIVLSNAYGRSSRYDGEKVPAANLFAVARLRPLTPAQYATTLRMASGDPDYFAATVKADEVERRLESVDAAARGMASSFEQPRDDFQISVIEALFLSNSDRVRKELLADGTDRIMGRLKAMKNPEEAVPFVVDAVLGRKPSDEEKRALIDYVAARQDRQQEAYRQVVWSLLTAAEMRFNY